MLPIFSQLSWWHSIALLRFFRRTHYVIYENKFTAQYINFMRCNFILHLNFSFFSFFILIICFMGRTTVQYAEWWKIFIFFKLFLLLIYMQSNLNSFLCIKIKFDMNEKIGWWWWCRLLAVFCENIFMNVEEFLLQCVVILGGLWRITQVLN